MNLTVDLGPEIERNLLVQARARGISLADFAKEVLTQAAGSVQREGQGATTPGQQAENLYELFTPIRGLLTDEEIDQYFARTRASSRPVDLG